MTTGTLLRVLLMAALTTGGCRQLTRTPLGEAARRGDVPAIRALVEEGAAVDEVDREGSGYTALQHAIHKYQQEAAATLLQAGADPDARGPQTLTPLIMAAGYGQTEIVRLLLEAGADPRAEVEGVNALWSATGGGALGDVTDGPPFGTCHPETIALLRSAAPDLRIRKSLSTWLLTALSRSEECSRLIADLKEP